MRFLGVGTSRKIILAIIIFFFYLYIFYNYRSYNFSETFCFILYSVFVGLVSSIGSDQSFNTVYTSGAIALPLFLSLSVLMLPLKRKFSKEMRYEKGALYLTVLFLFMQTGKKIVSWKPYRGGISSFKDQIVTSTVVPCLKGTYTNEKRMKSIDSLYLFCTSLPEWNNSQIVILNNAPFLYYMFNKPSVINGSWGPWLFLDTKDRIKNILLEYSSRIEKRDYIILATSAQRENWPDCPYPTVSVGYDDKYLYALQWLEMEKYILLYKNNSFSVFGNDILPSGFENSD
jgi:hypothetical protein